MKEGTIEKIGFNEYCLWYSKTDGMHFWGKKNILQARKLFRELKR